jgi:uncharacterized membrane protein YgaE (UPF0421/DUF939 family)
MDDTLKESRDKSTRAVIAFLLSVALGLFLADAGISLAFMVWWQSG